MDVIFWDVETTQTTDKNHIVTNHFWFLVAQYVRYDQTDKPETKVFKSLDDFWVWVMSKTRCNKKLWMVALNTDFDIRLSDGFNYLSKYGLHIHLLINESRLFILESNTSPKFKDKETLANLPKVYNDKRTISVLDMLN